MCLTVFVSEHLVVNLSVQLGKMWGTELKIASLKLALNGRSLDKYKGIAEGSCQKGHGRLQSYFYTFAYHIIIKIVINYNSYFVHGMVQK